MTDLTAQQLADLMLPLFERERELRPDGLECPITKKVYWVVCGEDNTGSGFTFLRSETATQLCESSMVRWLALEKITCEVGIDLVMSAGWDIVLPPEGVICHGDTLVQALAAACTAVLDTEEEPAG